MNLEILNEINQSQRERIFHIDFRMRFMGTITRNDLVTRFGIKEAAATRDIAKYREIAPNNLWYDTVSRKYFSTYSFKSIFEHTPEKALLALTTGIGDDSIGSHKSLVLCEIPSQLSVPDIDVLSVVSSAIHQERPMEVEYYSTNSGKTTRTIIPFALASNGTRWHVRAYDRKWEQFRDFVLTRMNSAKLLEDEVAESERKEADNQWNRVVDLEIVPHPNPTNLPHPETITLDYHMEDGVLHLPVRAAIAGYLLRRWNIDCTEDHSLEGQEYQLWLRNHPTLYGVSNAVLAPGYRKDLE